MAISSSNEFESWLNVKLRALNTDESIFGPYIISVLDSDETLQEKTEGLEGLLGGIIENDIQTIIKEILDQWNTFNVPQDGPPKTESEDVDVKLAKLLESNVVTATVQKKYTPEQLQIRSKILAQYSQLSDEEADEEGAVGAAHDDPGLVKNTNFHDVQQLMKERREQAKLESLEKKKKDKDDREKQRQLREEKKEKRKTVKQERKR